VSCEVEESGNPAVCLLYVICSLARVIITRLSTIELLYEKEKKRMDAVHAVSINQSVIGDIEYIYAYSTVALLVHYFKYYTLARSKNGIYR
jgi:hypothetical protein